jgi:hypothetical protein
VRGAACEQVARTLSIASMLDFENCILKIDR